MRDAGVRGVPKIWIVTVRINDGAGVDDEGPLLDHDAAAGAIDAHTGDAGDPGGHIAFLAEAGDRDRFLDESFDSCCAEVQVEGAALKAIETVEVRARVEGFLEKVLYREGQDVKAGDPLYQIEMAPYQAQVDQAKANLDAAEAQAANAEVQYRRSLQLVKQQFTPQATLDRDRAAMETTRAEVEQAKAALALAEINLGYTYVRSPIDGRISRTTGSCRRERHRERHGREYRADFQGGEGERI